jgi:hypothetical protein
MRVWMACLVIVATLLACGGARADERFSAWRDIKLLGREQQLTIAQQRANALVVANPRRTAKPADRAFVLDGGTLETHAGKRFECGFSILAMSCKTHD